MNKNLDQAPSQTHPAFELIRSCPIDSLNVVVEDYRHKVTGARHYHLASDSNENVFSVALKTIPTDSSGVAHILEHTVLCGSENYPVRDPFFMMLRRSLNTFMNAMTSSDWTAYPFASQNRKDFDNLLKVYLDAVFFSRLDPLDFAQEGHRIEFEEPGNADSPLQYKGVVFNEMKGAMSSVTSTLWQTLSTYLYPTTTYHFNSGGEPAAIPDLSYDQLLAFYRKHYHPSNAVFMTFGDIAAREHHERLEALCLARFEGNSERPVVPDEKRYLAPLRVSDHYALEGEDDCSGKTHIVMAWLWGKNTSLSDILEGHLLSGVLLDNSASPLRHRLETSGLGSGPSPLCGMDDSSRELAFVCGIEGSEPEQSAELERQVIEVLEDIAKNGVPASELEAILHQLEIHQREIGGDSYPYGLQLIMQGLGTSIHDGDPVELLNLDPVIEKLQHAITDPAYIKQLVQRLLLDNQHRVTLVMEPDTALAERKQRAEEAQLKAIRASMDDAASEALIAQATALAERQASVDDESVLPRITLADVPAEISQPSSDTIRLGSIDSHWYEVGTNGIAYQQYVVELPELDPGQRALLPHYAGMWTELGIGESDYLKVQQRQAACCGSISAFSSIRGSSDDNSSARGFITLSAKALNRNFDAMSELLRDTRDAVRFDEHQRMRELVAQSRAQREQSITGSGHSLAMMAATSSISPLAAFNHESSGLAGIQALKDLDQALANDGRCEQLASELQGLHHQLLGAPLQTLSVCEASQRQQFQQGLSDTLPTMGKPGTGVLTLPSSSTSRNQVWQTNTQVNFCAQAWPTVPMAHPDAPVLSVLGVFLRNGYLHGAIREKGGAYGAGASQDSNIGAFVFYSYRDPRNLDTLQDFGRSLEWLQSQQHSRDSVEQAILGVIGSLDKPASPAGEAKQHFHNLLQGRTDMLRAEFRQRVLQVTAEDLQRVAASWLIADAANTAIICPPSTAAELAPWIEQHDAASLHL